MKIAIIGEAMLELVLQGSRGNSIPFGGDTLNTAVHLARLGHEVTYVTAMGTDPASDALVEAWRAEGIDTRYVLRHPSRQPGIYAIHVDKSRERSFLYWRDQSAARGMFDLDGIVSALAEMEAAELLYFSHVSLAILPDSARDRLLTCAVSVRTRGGAIAYDSNYRPRLWGEPEAAARWSLRAMAVATIGLPTAEDERALHCTANGDDVIAETWRAAGVEEVVVKAGAAGCVLAHGDEAPRKIVCSPVTMRDSSGAGDAFNAGYLGARLYGRPPEQAATAGHALAAWVIQRPGALPASDHEAPYDALAGSGTSTCCIHVR